VIWAGRLLARSDRGARAGPGLLARCARTDAATTAGRAVLGLAVALALLCPGCGAGAGAAAPAPGAVHRDGIRGSARATAAVAALLAPVLASVESPARRGAGPVAGAAAFRGQAAARRAAAVRRRLPVAHAASGRSPRARAGRRGVSVWLPYWSMSAAYSSVIANASVVGTASPFWYTISGASGIGTDPGAGNLSVIDGLHARHVQVVPTVTETDGLRAFDRLLASAPRRAAMVRALTKIASSRDYNGLDLDFEEFAVDRAHDAALADDAAARYPGFVGEVCRALHAIARSCTVTIMPRTSGEKVYWRNKLATWVYDYGALAQVADRVRIMAYDEHAPGTAPGPVAPYPWVEQVVRYASATMPLGRAELALPAYGYDWSGGPATSVTAQQAVQLVSQTGASPTWSAAQAEVTFRYGSRRHRHTVWYEDAKANYLRARLAVAAGFAGVDLWYAGAEDPGVWPLLRGLYRP
jgi:spore germination protein